MSFLKLKHLLLFLHFSYAQTDKHEDKFNNYSVYEVTAFNARERAVLYSLYMRNKTTLFMNGITNNAAIPMDILVHHCCLNRFEMLMQVNNIEYLKVKTKNIINEDMLNPTPLNEKVEPSATNDFHDYNTIRRWVKLKIKRYSLLEEIKIGRTYEKRDIFVLKISTGKAKKAVFLMGGEEGRDWSSIAILLNLVENILEKKFKLENLIYLYDFYILPVFNPDGYMYSITQDRQWTKNTRIYYPKVPCGLNMSTKGINVDKNWYFHKLPGRNKECDPTFAGLTPLSEEETLAASTFLDKIALKIMAFINLRGFENLVTIPYGYANVYCNNYDVLKDILSTVHAAVIRNHNATFSYGLASEFMYNISGSAADWVKKQLNTPIVYTFYMKNEAFILPSPTDIQPLTAQLATMLKEILELAHHFYDPLFNNQFRLTLVKALMFNVCLPIIIFTH